MKPFLLFIFLLLGFTHCTTAQQKANPYYSRTVTTPLNISNGQWKKILPADVYYIAREEGTERAFTGKWTDNHAAGMYFCRVCGNLLFDSKTKFESGTGWPSFYQAMNKNSVKLKRDADGDRVAVECARCGSHLGHVFDDGPNPTGKRFCMNGTVLDFEAKK
jgi:peptide-methionine (R)-S-oxide reductase